MALAALFAKKHEEKLANGGGAGGEEEEEWEDDKTFFANMTRSGTSALITASASAACAC